MRDTIELCKEAGYPLVVFDGVPYVSPELERLVALVRADERAVSVQEPSGFFRHEDVCGDEVGPPTPYYLTPPAAQRQWVGLTDAEEVELWESTDSDWELMKRTEAKLKEKNT